MNGGPATGNVPVGGAAPPYQGAGQQAKVFQGKGSNAASPRKAKRNQKRATRRAKARAFKK
jgi:hypothetical protein